MKSVLDCSPSRGPRIHIHDARRPHTRSKCAGPRLPQRTSAHPNRPTIFGSALDVQLVVQKLRAIPVDGRAAGVRGPQPGDRGLGQSDRCTWYAPSNSPLAGRDNYRFAADVAFASPSAAASVVAARSASGPREWKVSGNGQTYRDWRAEQLGDGYASKLLAPTQIRRLGPLTIGPFLEALGLKMLVVEDEIAVARHSAKLARHRAQEVYRPEPAIPSDVRCAAEALIRECASMGAAARNAALTPEERSRRAAVAGKARWARLSPKQRKAAMRRLNETRKAKRRERA